MDLTAQDACPGGVGLPCPSATGPPEAAGRPQAPFMVPPVAESPSFKV